MRYYCEYGGVGDTLEGRSHGVMAVLVVNNV